jgi:hypothetical protein
MLTFFGEVFDAFDSASEAHMPDAGQEGVAEGGQELWDRSCADPPPLVESPLQPKYRHLPLEN